MAKLYVSEYAAAPGSLATSTLLVQEPSLVEQTPVAIGGSSTASAAFGATTRVVRLHTDAICSISFGTSPTATVSTKRMAANATEYFAVRPGDSVAVITNT